MPDDSSMSWQDAIAELAHERTLAEAGVALIKKHGSRSDIDHAFQRYTKAKAEYDGIIAGLIVALAQDGEPETLQHLEDRMRRAFDLRQEFSNDVNRLLPPQLTGKKGLIAEAIEGAAKALVAPLIDAVKAIWFRHKDDNALRRVAIQTQLAATKWTEFTAIPPAAD